MIVDAKGLVAGRLASKIAKRLINGEILTIVNAGEAVVVGKRSAIMPKFKQRVDASVHSNPHYGPKYDRIPSKILRRMVRGMLPNKKRTSERLITNLTVYNEIPSGMEKNETIAEVKCNEKHDFMSLKEVAELLGGKW
jgi:large subunit ribosomal protein L13